MEYPLYYSIDARSGEDVFHALNYFSAVVERDLLWRPSVIATIDKSKVARDLDSVFRNFSSFERALDSGLMDMIGISSWNLRKIVKLIERGQKEKAELKIEGFIAGVVMRLDANYVERMSWLDDKRRR